MKPQTADIREVAENHLLQMEQVIRRQHHSTDASFIVSTFNLSIIHRQPHSSSAPFIVSTTRRLSQLPSIEGDHAPGLRAAFDGYVDCDFSFQAGGGAGAFERNLQGLALGTDRFARAQVEGAEPLRARLEFHFGDPDILSTGIGDLEAVHPGEVGRHDRHVESLGGLAGEILRAPVGDFLFRRIWIEGLVGVVDRRIPGDEGAGS